MFPANLAGKCDWITLRLDGDDSGNNQRREARRQTQIHLHGRSRQKHHNHQCETCENQFAVGTQFRVVNLTFDALGEFIAKQNPHHEERYDDRKQRRNTKVGEPAPQRRHSCMEDDQVRRV